MTSDPRIISMVPSWTELLMSIGLNVVGRTRYCTEPNNQIAGIATVGGTKDWNLELVHSLKPDLIILDKEENPKSMSENHSIPFVATHVCDLGSCALGIRQIQQALKGRIQVSQAEKLDQLALRWEKLAVDSDFQDSMENKDWSHLPGVIQWVQKPATKITTVYYLIWKKPWMVASRETFIGSVFAKLGVTLSPSGNSAGSKYPEISINDLDPEKTLLLFSSEPFPFEKKISEIQALGFPAAIVDGQSFSWFGIRSLVFLEAQNKNALKA